MTLKSISSIMGKIVAPKQISNLIDGMYQVHARNIKNITFSYCNSTTTSLANRIAKKAHIASCKYNISQFIIAILSFLRKKNNVLIGCTKLKLNPNKLMETSQKQKWV